MPGSKSVRLSTFSLAIAAGLFGAAMTAAQQPARSGAFTAEQARAGRTLYQTACVSCHQADLQGAFEAPPLAGGNFMNTWRNRPASDLFTRIHNTMPISNPGSLSDQDAVNLVAFILQANGASAGTQPLAAGTNVPIGSVATGAAPQAAATGSDEDAAPRASSAPRNANVRLGLLVEGEVKNYVPVTDDMLLETGSGRLADGSRRLSGLEPQRALASHARQRERPASRVVLEHE